MPEFLARARWFGGKARPFDSARIVSSLSWPGKDGPGRLFIARVSYQDGIGEDYLVPLALGAVGKSGEPPVPASAILAEAGVGKRPFHLYDGAYDPGFRAGCLDLVRGGKTLKSEAGQVRGIPGKGVQGTGGRFPESRVLGKEQSNTSFLYGDRFILKLYRRPERGINPEIEITRFLTEETEFQRTPPFAGMLEIELPGGEVIPAAVLQGYVPHRDDAWTYTLGQVVRCLDNSSLEEQDQTVGEYLAFARLLGRRTAQLHRALASASDNPAFSPRPETAEDRRNARDSARELLARGLETLENALKRLDGPARSIARELLARKEEFIRKVGSSAGGRVTGSKIRIHGDYHLGQLLRTGNDVTIIDFEGEPARSLEERRRKRSPLVDAAGMVRSFHYAALGPIFLFPRERPDPNELFSRAADWYRAVSGAFLAAYRETMAGDPRLLPARREEESRLLDLFLIEKAAYELNYELNNRPDWAAIPIRGLLDLLT